MRRLLVALLVLCVAVPAIAFAANTDPKKRINAADQKKAASIVLRRGDFAVGWKRVPATPDSNTKCPGFDPNESDLTLTGEGEADFEYSQGFPAVYSASEVWATRANALASWTRGTKPALARCIAYFLRQSVEKEGGKITIVSQGRFAFPKVAPRTVAFRVVAHLTVEQPGQAPVTVPVTVHLIGLGYGRGDVALFASGLGPGVPIADLTRLAKLTATRMAAAKL